MAKSNTIPVPPTSLGWPPLGGRWFHWSEVEACFWPGAGKRSCNVDSILAEIKDYGGVYVLAWSQKEPKRLYPHIAKQVEYIGEKKWVKGRMEGFRWSAGFWGERAPGHSAAWSWD